MRIIALVGLAAVLCSCGSSIEPKVDTTKVVVPGTVEMDASPRSVSFPSGNLSIPVTFTGATPLPPDSLNFPCSGKSVISGGTLSINVGLCPSDAALQPDSSLVERPCVTAVNSDGTRTANTSCFPVTFIPGPKLGDVASRCYTLNSVPQNTTFFLFGCPQDSVFAFQSPHGNWWGTYVSFFYPTGGGAARAWTPTLLVEPVSMGGRGSIWIAIYVHNSRVYVPGQGWKGGGLVCFQVFSSDPNDPRDMNTPDPAHDNYCDPSVPRGQSVPYDSLPAEMKAFYASASKDAVVGSSGISASISSNANYGIDSDAAGSVELKDGARRAIYTKVGTPLK